jgi:hypothetical protein
MLQLYRVPVQDRQERGDDGSGTQVLNLETNEPILPISSTQLFPVSLIWLFATLQTATKLCEN